MPVTLCFRYKLKNFESGKLAGTWDCGLRPFGCAQGKIADFGFWISFKVARDEGRGTVIYQKVLLT